VEMLYQDGEFWFLEMNTRLQVEHCVTEMVTRLDLVAEQIRVAAGEPLSFTQDDVVPLGHAIECRINAEDVTRGFLPSPGRITRLRVPSGPGVRWDGGYESGDEVSQYYDNLVGKLIVWAPDRASAVQRAVRALHEMDVEGIHTTIPAHLALLEHPDFVAGAHSTKWVEEDLDLTALLEARAGTGAPASAAEPAEAPAEPDVPLVERTVPVEVNGKRFVVKVWLPQGSATGGATPRSAGRPRSRPATASGGGAAGSGTITAPMQGTIVKVLVAEGDAVELGQAVLVLEAMKMENHINAGTAGTVKEIRVAAGDTVGPGDVLAVIE
jgi:acetyl-CoA/propionyl-CoA carboxylase biotin carboxyl carrier protein